MKTWWTGDNSMSVTYVNNREQGINFQYDADGRALVGNGGFTYDAAGRNNFLDTGGHGTVAMSFDGDGRQIKTVETSYDEQFNEITETKHYVRSTVLGGQVLVELNQATSEFRRFVYAGPTVLAWIYSYGAFETVSWEQRDPSGATERGTSAQELDPLGADAGTHATAVPPADGPLMSHGTSYSPSNPNVTYSLDGIRVSANDFMNFAGMAFQDPLNLMEWFARTNSGKKKGSRRSGVSWGQPFEVIYDSNDKVVSIKWGEYDPELRNLNFGTTTSIFSNEGIPDLALLPQQVITIPLGNLRANMENLLKGDCLKFTTDLLARAATLFAGNYPHLKTVMEGYNKITSPGQGGYVLKTEGYDTVSGDLFANGAKPGTVELKQNALYREPTQKEIVFYQQLYAWKAIHETLHLGRQGHYDDEQLAAAAYSLAKKEMPAVPATMTGLARAAIFSSRFDDELKKYCPRPN